jgi:DNA-binding PadR family transcriptional regulator
VLPASGSGKSTRERATEDEQRDPVLRALSAAGLLDSHVVPSVAGPPRRYYRITDTGRATLADWLGAWRNTRDFVNRCTETGSP